jgi:hypothetical protein
LASVVGCGIVLREKEQNETFFEKKFLKKFANQTELLIFAI